MTNHSQAEQLGTCQFMEPMDVSAYCEIALTGSLNLQNCDQLLFQFTKVDRSGEFLSLTTGQSRCKKLLSNCSRDPTLMDQINKHATFTFTYDENLRIIPSIKYRIEHLQQFVKTYVSIVQSAI